MSSSIGKVRGKFVVNRIVRHRGSYRNPETGTYENCEMQTVELSATMGGSPEDNSYASASPAGKVELSITRPDVVKFFDLDKPYYLDFTPAE